jgi:hypothetical protein
MPVGCIQVETAVLGTSSVVGKVAFFVCGDMGSIPYSGALTEQQR